MSQVVWQSRLTADMVTNLNDNELSLLINALDDAVAEICESFEGDYSVE